MHIFIVKVGSSTLTQGSHQLSRRHMLDIIRQIAELRAENAAVILVSSGAVVAGREVLQKKVLEKVLPSKQMLASVGQVRLMEVWRDLAAIYQMHVGQMLLTRSDFTNRERYLNARDTLLAMLQQGILPIINENDAIVMRENRVGDNDNLAALIANMLAARLLVLLTDQVGLYTAHPCENPQAQLIEEVTHINSTIWQAAGGSTSGQGTGGMLTKVQAAALATQSGTPTVIANMQRPNVLMALWRGEQIGTLFHATVSRRESRKRWLLAEQPHGAITLDKGAMQRLCHRGASLLPVGIVKVEGSFQRGAIVQLLAVSGDIIGRGISNYSSSDIHQLLGLHSKQIVERLGYTYGAEVVHRDNLAILKIMHEEEHGLHLT